LAYIVLYTLFVLGIFSVANIKNNAVRFSIAVLFALSSALFDAYQNTTSEFLTYNTFISLKNAQGFAGEAFEQYLIPIVKSFSFAALLFIGMVLTPRKLKNSFDKYLFSAPLVIFTVFTLLLYVRGAEGGRGLPTGYVFLGYQTLYLYEESINTIGEREEIKISRSNSSINHDIILIIDESVASNYLDINNVSEVTTGLAHSYDNINIYNYGHAASITNCSAESNYALYLAIC